MKNFSLIIVAGGSGSRMGGLQKQFVPLKNKPVWEWSASVAENINEIQEIILVVPEDNFKSNTIKFNSSKKFLITAGGNTRVNSVLNGLKISSCDYVLIHDAARPFLTERLLNDLILNTDENFGAIPVLPVNDALKKIDDNENISSIDREKIYLTQTPQSFLKNDLIKILAQYPNVKDEAEAWLMSGRKLKHVQGERLNFKITWPEDLQMARALVENLSQSQKISRSGIGYDVHKLVPGRNLILGGVKIESELGLLGHSDADLLTHSIMDAILGAAGLPDIGNLFPASDEKFKNADSLKLLAEVLKLVHQDGWTVNYVDAVVEAQIPRLNEYLSEIKNSLGRFFDVNLKFKSAEEIDDTGSGLAMKAWAVAEVIKNV